MEEPAEQTARIIVALFRGISMMRTANPEERAKSCSKQPSPLSRGHKALRFDESSGNLHRLFGHLEQVPGWEQRSHELAVI